MAGTQGPNGKPLAPKVAKTATSGKPAGGPSAPSGGGKNFVGTRPSPTNCKARGPR
jgi:hypothetical protein